MIQKLLASALIAGGAAGLLAAVLHFAFVQDYILLGEQYETGAVVHFSGPVADGLSVDSAEHSHTADEEGNAHSHDTETPVSDLQRNGLTVVFSVLIYVSYALILVAGFGLAHAFGKTITARDGILWGIAGFAAFQLLPAMGLAPELPGTIAADLAERQVWWWGTVAASVLGFALLAYGGSLVTTVIGIGLLAAPHVVGAPTLGEFAGVAPPEVAAAFSARVLGVGLIVWAALGWIAGAIWAKEAATS